MTSLSEKSPQIWDCVKSSRFDFNHKNVIKRFVQEKDLLLLRWWDAMIMFLQNFLVPLQFLSAKHAGTRSLVHKERDFENGNLQFFPFLEFCWQRCILYFTIVLPILYIAFPTLQNSISNMIDLNNDTFLETLRYWQNELYGRPKNVQLMFIFGIFKKDNKLFFLLFWYDFYLFALYCLRGHWELLLWPRTSHEAS